MRMNLSRMTNYRVNVQLKKGLENENGSKGTLLVAQPCCVIWVSKRKHPHKSSATAVVRVITLGVMTFEISASRHYGFHF